MRGREGRVGYARIGVRRMMLGRMLGRRRRRRMKRRLYGMQKSICINCWSI